MAGRVLEVRIRFITPSLGNVRGDGGRFYLPRREGRAGPVVFSASWHSANIRSAARSCGLVDVPLIEWDEVIDGSPCERPWVQRRVDGGRGRPHFAVHESFKAGQVVAFRCSPVSDLGGDRFFELMRYAGRHCGLSPWRGDGGYGRFEVLEIRDVTEIHGESTQDA